MSEEALAAPDTAAPVSNEPATLSEAAVDISSKATAAEEAPKPSIDDTLKQVWAKNNPDRDPSGKFAARATAATEQPETTPAAKAETNPADTPKTEGLDTAKTPSIEPPQSLSAEAKAAWASVPPAVQQAVAKREAEAHATITRLGESAKRSEEVVKAYEPIGRVIHDHQETFRRHGRDPAEGLNQLLAAQRALDENPMGALLHIADSYGINLRAALQGYDPNQQPQNATGSPESHPAFIAMTRELEQVKSYLNEQQAAEHRAKQAETERARAEIAKEIEDFSRAENRPHFEAVRLQMAALLNSGAAKDLSEAYEQATHANPTIRALILADQRKAADDKRTAEEAARTAAARKAASVNVKGSAAAGGAPKSMDDTLREVFRKNHGRSAA